MDVIFQINGHAGEIILNRPKALNAIDIRMVDAITNQLLDWLDEPAVKFVIIRACEGKAFCAGGDVRAMYEEGQAKGLPKPGSMADLFFRKEYFMNHLIHTYAKPYVSLIDGICMGGGLGLSVHGDYRVVTENTLMAMPETAIGLFPDVGGTFFLNRCPGEMGLYLGMTGARIKAGDALYAGLATHYCSSAHIQNLRDKLITCKTKREIKEFLDELSGCSEDSALKHERILIDKHFGKETLADVMASLVLESGSFQEKTLSLLKGKSPTSLSLTFKQLRRGVRLSIGAALQQEFILTQHIMGASDFFEGVRALLVDKDKNPKWIPDNLLDVSNIDEYFDGRGIIPLNLEFCQKDKAC